MLRSPSIARLADTPPVVGSVSTEMYGSFACAMRDSTALVLLICSSDSSPSCMRAPPLDEKQISGRPLARQCSAPRVKRSPTTEPIEPPRKRNSNAQATTSMPCSAPAITIIASFSPTVFCAAVRRSRYFLLSRNLSGSSGSTSSASSRPVPSSRKPMSRSRPSMRMWWLHFGHTCRLRSSSAR